MAANLPYEAVDFEPDDDDLMDEDGDGEGNVNGPPPAPTGPRLRSAITGGAGDQLTAPRKTKGRGFRETEAERNRRFTAKDFESLGSDGGPGPQRHGPGSQSIDRKVALSSASMSLVGS